MHPPADRRRAAADRRLPVRMRGDLQVVEVPFAGAPSYVVKDPISEETFHFTAEEYALLDRLRQPASLRDLQRVLQSQFAPRRAAVADLQQFVSRVYEQGLLLSENAGQGVQLLERGRRQRRRERAASLLQLLSIRVGRFDAAPMVERLYAALGWICRRPVLIGAMVIMALAATLVISHAEELAGRLPAVAELLHTGRLPLWMAAIIGVKVLHEVGHGLACRHCGARPREFGILLLAGMPALYCDVSDAWRLPSKWQRMAVSGAGMFVELVIAAVAVIVWRYAEPGMLSAVCLSLIVVCSVGTLMVNANPLLRYDGYYLLADYLETPNLADRARGLIGGAWRQWLLGEPPAVDPLLSPRKRRALWLYAILAKAYMALVLTGVFLVMLRLARPHHLQNLVYALAAVTITGMAVRPVATAAQLAANPAIRTRFRWRRFAAAALLLGVLVAAIGMIPIKRQVGAPLTIVPATSHPLFAVTPGELVYAIAPGAKVHVGDVIVRLHNPELELALVEQRGAVQEQRTRLQQLHTLQATTPAASRWLPTAETELAAAERQLRQQQEILDSLTIRAPAAGTVLAPPERIVKPVVEILRTWNGSPLDERNRGAWIEPGTALAVVAESEGRQAWAGVQQADVPLVEAGQTVRLIAEQSPTAIIEGRVVEVARRARINRDQHAYHPPPADLLRDGPSYHVVRIEVGKDAANLLPGARGWAKIETMDATVGAITLEHLRRTFQRVF